MSLQDKMQLQFNKLLPIESVSQSRFHPNEPKLTDKRTTMHSSSSQSAVNGIMQQRTIRAPSNPPPPPPYSPPTKTCLFTRVNRPSSPFPILQRNSRPFLSTCSIHSLQQQHPPTFRVEKRIIEEIPKLRFGCTSSDCIH